MSNFSISLRFEMTREYPLMTSRNKLTLKIQIFSCVCCLCCLCVILRIKISVMWNLHAAATCQMAYQALIVHLFFQSLLALPIWYCNLISMWLRNASDNFSCVSCTSHVRHTKQMTQLSPTTVRIHMTPLWLKL